MWIYVKIKELPGNKSALPGWFLKEIKMLFNSYIFIFLFLPLTLLGWYGLNRLRAYESARFFLTGMSLWFYGYFNV